MCLPGGGSVMFWGGFGINGTTPLAEIKPRNWLGQRKLRVLEWPSKSPDLNPIENLWGIMARQVYAHGRQYNTLSELKSAVISAWNKLSLVTLRNLISSMKNRIFEVILNRGGITKY